MADQKYPAYLKPSGTNQYGGTFWTLRLDTTCDGRARGGLMLVVDVHTQKDGICIAGNYISWEDLHGAEKYAKSFNRPAASSPVKK